MADIFNNSNTSCYPFNRFQYIVLVSIRAGLSTISFMACLAVITIIILFKKYLFLTQRMILYLDITLLLRAFIRAMDSLSYDEGINLDIYCVIVGFLEQYSSLCVLIALTCFTVNIFIQVTFKRNTQKLEVIYLVFIFLFPALTSWIPFIKNAYGFAGAWCWIRQYDYTSNSCSEFTFGVILRFALYYLPYFIILPILLLLLVISLCKLHQQRYQYEARFDPVAPQRRTALRSEIKSLLWYPFFLLVLTIVPLATRIYDAADPDHPIFILWIFDSIFTGTKGTVIALIFTIDPETRKRLNWVNFKSACKTFCQRGQQPGQINEYPAELTTSSDSRRMSLINSQAEMSDNRAAQQGDDHEELLSEYHPISD